MYRLCAFVFISIILLPLAIDESVLAQPGADELVTYEKESAFIKEFPVPFEERGLRGITVDSDNNVWFYHSTTSTSTLVMFEPGQEEFTQYQIAGETVADDAIISLASAQLVFDDEKNAVWFTDARINSVGMLDVESGKISLWAIPTEMAGPMGIALSPDGRQAWFTEITGDNIAQLDVESGEITEYSTGDGSGPALLTFDDKGQLWVTLSFSNSILLIQPWVLVPGSSLAMTKFSPSEPDQFSPFGIAVAGGKIFLSDHGSSRILVVDEDSVLQDYELYWTSPSRVYPTTLPSQVVVDGRGNVYFAQHGGNRISEIAPDGIMTEYEVPTGPLSTVVFLSSSQEGRVWFAEWASNKIGFLDTTIDVPFSLQTQDRALVLDATGTQTLNVTVSREERTMSPSQVEIGLAGMSESGLTGIIYEARPPRTDLQVSPAESKIDIRAAEDARPGDYTVMVRASALESDGLTVSKLYPLKLVLDVPEPIAQGRHQEEPLQDSNDITRYLAIVAIVGLVGFMIYRRIRKKE